MTYVMSVINVPQMGEHEKQRMLELGQEHGEVESHGPDEAGGLADALSTQHTSYLSTDDREVAEAWLEEGKILRRGSTEGEKIRSVEDL